MESINEAIERVMKRDEISFISGRYPYTYAYDFLREHPNVLPVEIYYAPDFQENFSRAEASRFVGIWADMAGESKEWVCTLLAEAYLTENGIKHGD